MPADFCRWLDWLGRTPVKMSQHEIGAAPQSGFVLVKQSPGVNQDFSCGTCRWGDYSGATPDPVADMTQPVGRVWLTNEWNAASANDDDIDWRTWNWAAVPRRGGKTP